MLNIIAKISVALLTIFVVLLMLSFRFSDIPNNSEIILKSIFISKVQAQTPRVKNDSNVTEAGLGTGQLKLQ